MTRDEAKKILDEANFGHGLTPMKVGPELSERIQSALERLAETPEDWDEERILRIGGDA